jgi:hypothetical protein
LFFLVPGKDLLKTKTVRAIVCEAENNPKAFFLGVQGDHPPCRAGDGVPDINNPYPISFDKPSFSVINFYIII